MSTAICTVCAKGYHFGARRGSKLSERVCTCGRPLTLARWDHGYVPVSIAKEKAIREAWATRGMEWDGYAREESFGDKRY